VAQEKVRAILYLQFSFEILTRLSGRSYVDCPGAPSNSLLRSSFDGKNHKTGGRNTPSILL
jgi:hypothetical protein